MVARGPQSVTPPPVPSAWQTPQPKKDPTSIAVSYQSLVFIIPLQQNTQCLELVKSYELK